MGRVDEVGLLVAVVCGPIAGQYLLARLFGRRALILVTTLLVGICIAWAGQHRVRALDPAEIERLNSACQACGKHCQGCEMAGLALLGAWLGSFIATLEAAVLATIWIASGFALGRWVARK